jgi:hypothetical protein
MIFTCWILQTFSWAYCKVKVLNAQRTIIYIVTGDTKNDALDEIVTEKWNESGIAVLKKGQFNSSSQEDKEKLVIKAIGDGLMDLCKIDHLDKNIITSTIKEANKVKLNYEIPVLRKKTGKYEAQLSYKILRGTSFVQPFIKLKVLDSDELFGKELPKIRSDQVQWLYQNMIVTDTQIKIKSSRSLRASVWLEKLKPNPIIGISDLLSKVSCD